ncbi:hypothetical protein AYO37_00125 [Opitutia bacterium SCGC AG-212-L18]|nr:hypothetical protein AYO37_00125 [Opitutae bacterium SCGC AG-212-L18]
MFFHVSNNHNLMQTAIISLGIFWVNLKIFPYGKGFNSALKPKLILNPYHPLSTTYPFFSPYHKPS